jgi:hypothetical protein
MYVCSAWKMSIRSLAGFKDWLIHGAVHGANASMLSLYRTVSAVHPDLSEREHFRLLVMARKGCDSTVANLVLERAEESFAQWPVPRELTLCDLVHYLTVSEYFAAHAGEPWMSSDANINLIIKSHIPHGLCVDHKKE